MAISERSPAMQIQQKVVPTDGEHVRFGKALGTRRVLGTIMLRTGPIEVDDTLLTWEKRLAL